MRGAAPSVPLPTTLLHFTALLLRLFNRQSTNFQIISIPFQTISPPPNTVGYVQEGVTKANFNALGIPFTQVDGKGFQLNDISGDLYSGGDFFSSDQIWIWDPLTSGYDMWYYYSDSTHLYDGWYDQGTGEIPFENKYPNGLPAGTPVWYVATGTIGAENTFDVTFTNPIQ